jgi:hypothetical protein
MHLLALPRRLDRPPPSPTHAPHPTPPHVPSRFGTVHELAARASSFPSPSPPLLKAQPPVSQRVVHCPPFPPQSLRRPSPTRSRSITEAAVQHTAQ